MNGNKYPLVTSGDMGMYYNSTYVFSQHNGEPQAMYVDVVERKRNGDETQLSGVELIGMVYNKHGEVDVQRWCADTIEDFRPISGYIDFGGGGGRSSYVTYNVPNRTQKKGLDSRQVLVNGAATGGLRGHQMAILFGQTLDMVSNPAARDFYIAPRTNVVMWKGLEVGKLVDGLIVCNQTHKNKEAVLCRLLQNS